MGSICAELTAVSLLKGVTISSFGSFSYCSSFFSVLSSSFISSGFLGSGASCSSLFVIFLVSVSCSSLSFFSLFSVFLAFSRIFCFSFSSKISIHSLFFSQLFLRIDFRFLQKVILWLFSNFKTQLFTS